MNNIINVTKKCKFSYEEIKNKSIISLLDDKQYDINVIVGFRGRKEFLSPLLNSFKNAFAYYNNFVSENKKSFCFTFVEHSKKSEFDYLKKESNYLWTPGNVSEQYSRSFAYNFGVKYSNKAKYLLLHDLDILVKENFFVELFQNLGTSKCLQTYGKRRVLYLSQELTQNVINKKMDFNTLNEHSENVSLPMYAGKPALGSKGGSILIERELYYDVGGFDAETMYGYSPEDQLFWDKVTTNTEIAFADNPPIDMFHMWHPPTSMSNPLMYEMEKYMLEFRYMKKKDRLKYLEIQKENFKDGE